MSQVNDGEGCFAAYQIDQNDSNFGWKHYPLEQCKEDEGSRLHAYTEKVVLEFLKDKSDLDDLVAQMVDSNFDNESLQLKMKNVKGISLLDLLNIQGKMTVDLAMNITSKLVKCLTLLHTKYNIAHGDLKPDNIMIDEENNPILIDWGCSSWGQYTKERDIGTGNVQCASPQLVKRLKGKKTKI